MHKKTGTYTTTVAKANQFAIILMLPITALYGLPYGFLWGVERLLESIDWFLVWMIPVFIVGAVVHELIHGITWAVFAKNGWKSIKFGIKWKLLTPYCHCKEPLKKPEYFLGAIMPLVLMGILPGIYAIITGNAFVLLFAIFFSWAAGGDILGVWMLRKVKRNARVADDPNELGFRVVE